MSFPCLTFIFSWIQVYDHISEAQIIKEHVCLILYDPSPIVLSVSAQEKLVEVACMAGKRQWDIAFTPTVFKPKIQNDN